MIFTRDSRYVTRGCLLLPVVFFFLAGAKPTYAQGCGGVSANKPDQVTWTPAWCQEFNGAASSPDTTVWSFDLGSGGWGNNEAEVYCGPPGYPNNPPQCPATFSTTTNTVYIDGGGHLVIQPINGNGTWISTRMKTQGIMNFQYGRIEASMQLPDTTNQGLWPAFWSLGSDIATTPWPACGEADIMEDWSPSIFNGPGPNGNKATIHTTATGGSGKGGSYTFLAGQQADTAFHSYGVIWSANMMQYYVDDPRKPYFIVTPSDLTSGDSWPFNAQIFLITNVAVGGTLGGSITNLVNPQPLMFDYVRQYTASAVPAPTLGNPPPITVKAGATTGNTSTFTPAVTPGTGFVYFTCTTDAPKASCAITTTDLLNHYVVNSSNPAESVTAGITTAANGGLPPFLNYPKVRIWLPIVALVILLSTILAFVLRSGRRAWLCAYMLAAGFILALGLVAGCGGPSSVTTPPPPNNGTTPGAYTVTVYAFTESNVTDGSAAHADASVSIPITVN